jgi:glutamate synthase domain-containing protein 2/glutamate synthase domain-containing protein 1/glutamate synthase domain-containing protein 3
MRRDHERDACGIGFIADSGGRASHEIVRSAIDALCRVRHRGALDADSLTGDGAGLLLPIPRALVGRAAHSEPEFIGVAMCFSWSGRPGVHRPLVEEACRREGIDVIGWREVPTDPGALGDRARRSMPVVDQAILLRPIGAGDDESERRCIRARKRAEKACSEAGLRAYFPSFSFLTVTYKALCAADQLAGFYPDLADPRVEAPFAVFHQRFSTNTSPTWERAQPFRMICHNGEINTIQGNLARMKAREGRLGKVNLLEEELLRPVIDETGSDSAMLDNTLELLTREGREVNHAMAMLIPAAWEDAAHLDPEVRDFYRYHASLMEPWDGPAAIIFTDGKVVGARLDRNGLRPLRYALCEDGTVAVASEAGAIEVTGRGTVRRGKLGPGQSLTVDPEAGLDEDPVGRLSRRRPYGRWITEHLRPASLGEPDPRIPDDLLSRQVAFGFTKEEFTTVIRPMATAGHEPTSSMGDDTSPAVLSDRPRVLYNYFKQRFAQVTNPPIDHLRERSVMSHRTLIGPHDPLLWERPEGAAILELESFFLFKPLGGYLIDATFPVEQGPRGLRAAVDRISNEAEESARHGSGILLLSDAGAGPDRAPVPMLLAVGAVHHRLLRSGHRTRVSVVVETDEAREVHHFACLLGYGAEAICPRLALASLADLVNRSRLGEDIPVAEALSRYRQAVEEGVLKVLSKMGISTTDSYRGAQIFDAIGLDREVIDLCFAGTHSPLGGVGIEAIAEDVLRRHLTAYGVPPRLENPGYFKHHSGGEYHSNNPKVVDALHEAVENLDWEAYRRFAALIEERPATEIRDLLELVPAGPPVPVSEVEPAEAITARFSTGAISHGAIGAEAHETLAVALNMIGGKANTGEGGESPARYRTDRNCRIKQVASGRFGVTPEYCAFADELQIKMAQGSKPGEGGQLPGHKVTAEIARLRHTRPGVALISPPPHHDIYSIEDLAQLIFDLKQVNPAVDVSVKLVAEVGVGTVAAGVAKALADVVHVAGWDGGTGASPLSSIKNAGLPWEIGLSETRLALMENGLRDRVRIRVDGGMKSGRDVMMAALLGADEYAFGTAVLLAEGCIMVRACHRDTCPVGIATQRPDLRAKFAGTPEKVAAYLRFVAQEVRETLASLGLRSLQEAVGRVDLLRAKPAEGRASGLDLAPLLESAPGPSRFVVTNEIQRPRSSLGDRLYEEAFDRIADGEEFELRYEIGNADRTVGARLGGALAETFGSDPPPGRVTVRLTGQAGQSFGAFLSEGVALHLTGEANDYVGKGMGGGTLAISPPPDDAGEPYLAGNTVLYGATGGRLFLAGRAGERFCVRNSGGVAVAEGAGDHACEYMTGGTTVILGPVGWNMGAGMTGGQAFVWDPDLALPARVNPELVDLHRLRDVSGAELLDLVADHAEATGSARAFSLLENWEEQSRHFWRVAPKAEVAEIESAHEASFSSQANIRTDATPTLGNGASAGRRADTARPRSG